MKKILRLTAVLLSLCLCGCASADTELALKVGELSARVEALEAQVAELKKQPAAAQSSSVQAPQEQPVQPQQSEPQHESVPLSGDLVQLTADTVENYRGGSRYSQIAKNPDAVTVLGGMEYQIGDFEGQPIHVLLINLDADKELHGITAGIVLLDFKDGRIHDETTVDLSALEDNSFDSYEELLAYMINAYGSMLGGYLEGTLINQTEIRTELSQGELSTINGMLAQ